MKLFFTLSSLLMFYNIHAQDFFATADAFFKQHVQQGKVDYEAIKNNPQQLNILLNTIADYSLQNKDVNHQKAFYINTYNLLVIKTIVDNLPLNSPMDKSDFFDGVYYIVQQQKMSLNQLEKGLIFKQFPDARLHFVLVCGAVGCPPITNFAYTPNDLNNQLEQQTQLAINHTNFVAVDSTKKNVTVSEIFNWYKKDFETDAESLIGFFNRYLNQKIPNNYSVKFSTYNWSLNTQNTMQESPSTNLNIQNITPAVLMQKGQFEFKLFSNLYTQTKGFDSEGNRFNAGGRATYFTQINQFLFGWNNRINFGFDVWTKSVRTGAESENPLNIFYFQNDANNRSAVSGIGPKIKITPFSKIKRLSIQSTYLIPIAKDMQGRFNGRPFLSNDAHLWLTQFFYDVPISAKFQLFFQSAAWLYVNRVGHPDGGGVQFANPVSVFFSYFPNNRITLYYQNEFWPNFGSNFIDSYFRQEGAGFKYQIIPGLLEGEFLFTNFFAGKNAGAGKTYNFGLRIIR